MRVAEVFFHVLWQKMPSIACRIDQNIGGGRGNRAIQYRLERLVARLSVFETQIVTEHNESLYSVGNKVNNVWKIDQICFINFN